MFTPDFYPTPDNVIEQMLFGVDIAGKVILEPSCGKGNIVDYLKRNGAKEVIGCEKHEDLRRIASQKRKIIGDDFLQLRAEQISHIDLIVANPPFSADEKHILHMIEIAPAGCEIVSLCNKNTLTNKYTRSRTELFRRVERFGYYQELGSVFAEAERQTNVEVAVVRMNIPKSGEDEFSGYFDMNEDVEAQQNGIMGYNEIRSIVNRYVSAVKLYDEVLANAVNMNSLITEFSPYMDKLTFVCKDSEKEVKKGDFKKELQKKAWGYVFGKMNMGKYVTRSVMSDINKFVEQQERVPFTMRNVYKMIEMIVGTHGDRMNRVLVDAFEKICSYSSENSEAGEGWKTNSSYKVNQKFILPWIVDGGFNGKLHIRSGREEDLDDIVKAICNMTGKNYDSTHSTSEGVELRDFVRLCEFCNYT